MHLSETKPRYGSVIVLFSIYDAATRKQNLSMLRNVKLVASDDDTGDELFVVDVAEQGHDKASVFIGEFSRKENEWEFLVSNRADAENNVVLLSTQFGIRRDWRHIKI
jgi:stress response protein SCP2